VKRAAISILVAQSGAVQIKTSVMTWSIMKIFIILEKELPRAISNIEWINTVKSNLRRRRAQKKRSFLKK